MHVSTRKALDYAEAVRKDGYTETLEKIDRYLQINLADKYTKQEISTIALKFRFNKDDGKTIDTDLLLSPFWETQNEQFVAMRQVNPPLKRLM